MVEQPPNDPVDARDLAGAEEAAAREAAEGTPRPEATNPAEDDRSLNRHSANGGGPERGHRAGPAATGSAAKGRSGTGTATPVADRPQSISISQGGIQIASADAIDVRQGGIGRAEARDVAVTMGGIGFARGERISVELGGMGAGIGREVHLTQGAANLLVGRDVTVEQSLVQTVAAANVRFERPSVVVFLLARRVEGSVRTLFDWRAAIAFGAAAGLVTALFRRRR